MIRGETLGSYRIEDVLGLGGMGTVYRAVVLEATDCLRPGETVALKIIHPHLVERPGVVHRFLREAELGRKVRHPNVVHIFGAETIVINTEPCHFLVMEYVVGRELRQLLEEMGTVPDALLREIALKVASGLAAIHEGGIVHRDIKAENVLISRDQQVKIMDLGVAKVVHDSMALTETGQFVGSLCYASPEQFLERELGPRSDLYSLGVLLLELATGTNPFARMSVGAVMIAQLELVPPPARESSPEVSPFISEVVACLLAKEPADRFESAEFLSHLLEEAEQSTWWEERRRGQGGRKDLTLEVPVRRDTELFGREGALQIIRDAFCRASSGQGTTLFLEGEAGIGKSRLVDSFIRELDLEECHALYGSYPPPLGVGALRDAILGKLGSASLEKALRKYLTVAPSLVRPLAALLKQEAPEKGAMPIQGDALHTAMCHVMHGLSAEKPLLWIVEDLQFAEKDERQIVFSLARALKNHRVLLLVTSRPGLPEDELLHLSRFQKLERLTLGRLSDEHVTDLLREATRSESVATQLGPKIAERSDGVPLFIIEIVKGLRGPGAPESLSGKIVPNLEIGVPGTLRILLEARLRDLTREERAILDVAAVLGLKFDPDLVARVLGRPKFGVLQDLAALERRTRVVRGEQGLCRFDHHLIQTMLYQDLTPDLRAECHTLIAAALADRWETVALPVKGMPGEIELLIASHHLSGSQPEMALPFLKPALEHLLASHRNEAGLRLASDALRRPELLSGGDRIAVLLQKAALLNRLARRHDEQEVLKEALRLAGDTKDSVGEGRVRADLGRHYICASRHETAREWLVEAVRISEKAGDHETEQIARNRLGVVLANLGRSEAALEQYMLALSFAKECGNRLGEASIYGSLGALFQTFGRFQGACGYHERSLAIAHEIGSRVEAGVARADLGRASEALGLYGEARGHRKQQLAISREVGDRRSEVAALVGLGRIWSTVGGQTRAGQILEESSELAEVIGDQRLKGHVSLELGTLEERRGRLAVAERHYTQTLTLHAIIPYPESVAFALLSLGRLMLTCSRMAEARIRLRDARDLSRELGALGALVQSSAYLACLSEGDTPSALELLSEYGPRLDLHSRMESHYVLWSATADAVHLKKARNMLLHIRNHAPRGFRRALLANVPLHSAILAARNERCR